MEGKGVETDAADTSRDRQALTDNGKRPLVVSKLIVPDPFFYPFSTLFLFDPFFSFSGGKGT